MMNNRSGTLEIDSLLLSFVDFIHSLVKIPCFRCIPWLKILVGLSRARLIRGEENYEKG
jgi:hypothetical protein